MPRKQGHICQNCRFSTENITEDGEVVRECRRNAPLTLPFPEDEQRVPRAAWPRVKDEEWCGEFSSDG